jgi:CHASE3 domain sensor protein
MNEMLERIVKATEEMRDALTEGHQFLTDLRHERRRLESLITEARNAVAREIEEATAEKVQAVVDEVIAQLVEDFTQRLDADFKRVEDSIDKRFDQIMNLLTTGTSHGRSISIAEEIIQNGKAPFQQKVLTELPIEPQRRIRAKSKRKRQ